MTTTPAPSDTEQATDRAADVPGHIESPRHGTRTPARKPANGPAKLARRYPGRDRLDAAVNDLRRAFANLAREAAVAADDKAALRLAELLDHVVTDLKRTTAAAEAALVASARSQADVGRELDKLRTAMNRTPAGRARTLYELQIGRLEAMLVDPESRP